MIYLIEEKLMGQEFSLITFTDGKSYSFSTITRL